MSKLQTDPLSELGHFKQSHDCLVSSKLICFLGTFHALNTFKIKVLSKKENASGKTDQFLVERQSATSKLASRLCSKWLRVPGGFLECRLSKNSLYDLSSFLNRLSLVIS